MPRYKLPYSLIKPSNSKYFYFKLGSWKSYKSTGTTSRVEAQRIAQEAYVQSLGKSVGPTFREYAEPFYAEIWKKL